MPLFECVRLEKSYGVSSVLHSINLSVQVGEVILIVGDNGAGKSTLLRCLSGLIPFDEGYLELEGEERILAAGYPGASFYRKVASSFEELGMYEDLSLEENLELASAVSHLADIRITDVLERLKLTEVRGKRLRHCSQGMRQRARLARAFLRQPKLLVCDEPFSHLDESGQDAVWGAFIDYAAEGRAVIISSPAVSGIVNNRARQCRISKGTLV